MPSEPDPLRRVLEEAPGSVRALAEEAGLSDTLLLLVRDGERRLTPRTRQALVSALRRWGERCHELADLLENDTGTPQQEDPNE